jgi:hypothetical protein
MASVAEKYSDECIMIGRIHKYIPKIKHQEGQLPDDHYIINITDCTKSAISFTDILVDKCKYPRTPTCRE